MKTLGLGRPATDPSPDPRWLVKAPAAGHPLPKGEGLEFVHFPLSPLGERVDRTGVFFSRGGPGEGVASLHHVVLGCTTWAITAEEREYE